MQSTIVKCGLQAVRGKHTDAVGQSKDTETTLAKSNELFPRLSNQQQGLTLKQQVYQAMELGQANAQNFHLQKSSNTLILNEKISSDSKLSDELEAAQLGAPLITFLAVLVSFQIHVVTSLSFIRGEKMASACRRT